MCVQCVTGASVVAVASATGLRAWLKVKQPRWVTPRRMKMITAGLLCAGVIAAGIQV